MTLKPIFASVSAALMLSAAPAFAQAIPIEQFARNPAISDFSPPSMSVEGDFIVGIVTVPGQGNTTGIAVWDIGGKLDTRRALAPARITPSGNKMELIGARALSSGLLIAQGKQVWTGQTRCLEGGGSGAVQTVVRRTYYWDKMIDPKKFKTDFANLAVEENECSKFSDGFSLSPLPLEPGFAIGVAYDAKAQADKYYKVDLKNGKKSLLYQQAGELEVGYIDPRTGLPIVREKLESVSGGDYEIQRFVKNAATGEFDREKPLDRTIKARNTLNIVGYDDATGKLYVATDKFTDKVGIYFYDPKTDQYSSEPIFAHPEFDALDVILGTGVGNYNKPLGFRYQGATVQAYWIDPEMKSIADGLEKAFSGQTVDILDYNGDLSKVLIAVSASDKPPTYQLLVDKSKLVSLGMSRPWLATHKLEETKLVYYTARDGLKIPAFLTPAMGWKKGDKPAPTIIMPHGGPWVRDYADWDVLGWNHFFSSRGYHVLQPQYRGSEGFGLKLWKAGDNEWGQKMQDDKDDGAAWLVKEGYAAKDRIAMHGYSYGGFAAFAATVRDNSPYQCAIAGAGVSNLELFKKNVSRSRIARALQGHTMTGMSPLTNADKAKLPLLVIHGNRDVRVPIKDGRDFYNAVKAKVSAKFVEIKDMPHSAPWTPEQITQYLSSIESYLKTDCGPGGL